MKRHFLPTMVGVLAASLLAGCSEVRHPLDDSETRPATEVLAIDEAESTMDQIGEAVMGGAPFDEDIWVAQDGCATTPFSQSQGDVGSVLARTYSAADLSGLGSPGELLEEYESYWSGKGESVAQSSPTMDPGAVARVNGIGYEVVSLPPDIEMRAFIPCY